MADVRVREVDDALSGLLEILGVFVDCRNPSERLVWWRNVVAVGRKDDDWIPDPPEVSSATLASLEKTLFKLVADEQVFNNRKDLFPTQEIKTVPPTLELQKTRLLTVDVGEELGVLLPNSLFGLEVLEILRQPGSIEAAIAQVGRQMRQPAAAKEPSGKTHRIDTGLASPI